MNQQPNEQAEPEPQETEGGQEDQVDETPTLIIAGVLLLAVLGGIGWGVWYLMPEQALRRTAVNYANTANGHREGETIRFWSPPMRELAEQRSDEEGTSTAEMVNRISGKTPTRFSMPEVSPEHLNRVVIRGRFGWTEFIIPGESEGARSQRLQFRWVRDGVNWYLFQGFDAEREAYGEYPFDGQG